MKTMLLMSALLVLQAPAWRGSTTAGLTVTENGNTVTIQNAGRGSVDLWRPGSADLSGAYTVRATLRKLGGRQHEGYGFLFGGRNLGTDSARYSYVLIRGDGAVLVKKRDGAQTPVVRDWQVVPAVHADDAQSRAENTLELRIGRDSVVAMVNGTRVAAMASAELYTDGQAGLRLSHSMQVEVAGFTAR